MARGPASEHLARLGPAAVDAWELVRRHFELGEGFALIVVLVPDVATANVCADDLAERLAEQDRTLLRIPLATPADVDALPARLLEGAPASEVGAVWIASVIQESAADFGKWQMAWRVAAAGLNERRDVLRARYAMPIVLVGAPWFQAMLREVSPDLWSVRTVVAALAAAPVASSDVSNELPLPEAARGPDEPSLDPYFALHKASHLPPSSLQRARMLQRAALAFMGRHEWQEAERIVNDALTGLDLSPDWAEMAVLRAELLILLTGIYLEQGRYEKALETSDAAIACVSCSEWSELASVVRCTAGYHRGRALARLERSAEAEQALKDASAGSSDLGPEFAAGVFGLLGEVQMTMGRNEEAEDSLRRALALAPMGLPIFKVAGISLLLVDVLVRRKQLADAERLLMERIESLAEDNQVIAERFSLWRRLSLLYLEMGRLVDFEHAIAQARKLVRRSHITGREWMPLAEAMSRLAWLDYVGAEQKITEHAILAKEYPSFSIEIDDDGRPYAHGWIGPTHSLRGRYHILLILPPGYGQGVTPSAFVLEPELRQGAPHLFANGSLCLDHTSVFSTKATLVTYLAWVNVWLVLYEGWLDTGVRW